MIPSFSFDVLLYSFLDIMKLKCKRTTLDTTKPIANHLGVVLDERSLGLEINAYGKHKALPNENQMGCL